MVVKNDEAYIQYLFSSLSLKFKISPRTALRSLLCLKKSKHTFIIEFQKAIECQKAIEFHEFQAMCVKTLLACGHATQCNETFGNAMCAENTFGCLCNFEQYAVPEVLELQKTESVLIANSKYFCHLYNQVVSLFNSKHSYVYA